MTQKVLLSIRPTSIPFFTSMLTCTNPPPQVTISIVTASVLAVAIARLEIVSLILSVLEGLKGAVGMSGGPNCF